MKDRNNCKL